MADDELFKRIVVDPKVMIGKPVILGTHFNVEHILNLLAHGTSTDEIIAEYQGLTVEDVRACILFRERYPLVGKSVKYDKPFDSVAQDDWNVMK